MNEQPTSVAARGEIRVVGPGDAKEFWQPVPANGHIAIHLAPGLVPMDIPLGLGTQTVAPGCYVREARMTATRRSSIACMARDALCWMASSTPWFPA
jgi:hypothetical protein